MKWISVLAIVVAVVLLVRALPLDTAIQRLETEVEALGVLGPIVFGACYVAAVLLFVPGLALTLAAGAVFGLVGGMITVSLASTVAAALAFLIARYLARDRVAELAKRQPKFGAIDRAIGEGGWRIIALLRLVPAFPFSAGNYMFGLTAARFWPYTLASWVFMAPGTFMYVYLGHVGAQSVAAAGGEVETGRIVLLAVGLVAAVVATVYITKLAKRAIAEQSELEVPVDSASPSEAGPTWPRTIALAVIAMVSMGGAVWAQLNQARLSGLFGAPVVEMTESYADSTGTETFDHGAFDRLLRAHVDAAGLVDYAALAQDSGALDAYIKALATPNLDEFGRDERLAFLINAYNAFTLRLILDHYPIDSIKDIPAAERWDKQRWQLGGDTVSLNRIEHELIRPNFKEPRIHFALVCAAIGCPKLRNEAYTGARLEQQLTAQTRDVHADERWFRFDPAANTVHLTMLYNWYGTDFAQAGGSVLGWIAERVPAVKAAIESGDEPTIAWLEYDWSLNDKAR